MVKGLRSYGKGAHVKGATLPFYASLRKTGTHPHKKRKRHKKKRR